VVFVSRILTSFSHLGSEFRVADECYVNLLAVMKLQAETKTKIIDFETETTIFGHETTSLFKSKFRKP